MNSKDVTITVIDTLAHVDLTIASAIEMIAEAFVPPKGLSNSETDNAHVMHKRMAAYEIMTTINSAIKKSADQAKKDLDTQLEEMSIDPASKPGQLVEMYSDYLFVFDKKQNQDGTTALVTDLVTQLARLGVEKDVVDKALKNATKPKRGNVYYQIGTK
jgi:hypothetical protein